MEYLNMVMGISTYLFTVTIIAAFRRGEGEGRSMFKYFIDFPFLFYSTAGGSGLHLCEVARWI